MACKKPILMAIDGVSRQLVEDADAGIFVEPENIDHFTQVVRQFASDSALRTRQGENGYQYVKLHFDRKVLADQYLMEITSRIKSRN